MASMQTKSRRLAGALTALTVIAAGAGWTLRAAARQNPPARSVPPAKVTPPPAPPDRADSSKEGFNSYFEDWKYDAKTGILTGSNFHVVLERKGAVITGQSGRWDEKKRLLDAAGSLVLEDAKYRATGDKAHVDDGKAKLAVLTGNIIIVIKPEEGANAPGGEASSPADARNADPGAAKPPAGPPPPPEKDAQHTGSERKRGGTITCDRVEDYYKRKFIIMRGHFTFKQRLTKQNGQTLERTLTAEHAEYDGKTDSLLLFAPVDGQDTDGQEFHSPENVTVGTKTGAETLQGKKIRLKGFIEEEAEGESQPDKSTPPANPPDKPQNKPEPGHGT